MARTEKTVFISYRRTDVYTALAVYENLKNQGYDVFFDYRSISSGDFEQIITSNIKARAHFLLILTPTALDRCNEPGDWLRREIEFAIDQKRNIIPLFFKGFRFGDPSITDKLTGKLKNLSRYNGLNIHEDYFDEAMQRLQTQYLNIPLETVLHPISTEVQKIVRAEQVAADKALEQIEDVKQLVKQTNEESTLPKPEPYRKQTKFTLPDVEKSTLPNSRFNFGLTGVIAASLLILGLLIWRASGLFPNLSAPPKPTQTLQANTTSLIQLPASTLSSSTLTTVTLPPSPSADSAMTGNDGMTSLYVPAGEFTMGSTVEAAFAECQSVTVNCRPDSFADETPPHPVFLNAYWIDKTEVTNQMYLLCVKAHICAQPRSPDSYTRTAYYGDPSFDSFPVINVDWDMANAYCNWVGRRLPTEAEWEKAARGTDAFLYPWGNQELDGTRANFCDKNCPLGNANQALDDGYADTAPVDTYPNGASPYGALNMAGNVSEWVSDWYEAYPGNDPNSNPYFGQTYHVIRGGAWGYLEDDSLTVHSAYRRRGTHDFYSNQVGFRCAMSATP